MGSDEGEKVQLYVYDLSNGLARQLSPMLLNKQVFAASVLSLIDPAAGYGRLNAVLYADRRHLAHSCCCGRLGVLLRRWGKPEQTWVYPFWTAFTKD